MPIIFIISILIMPVLVSVLFFIGGAIQYCFPPKKINWYYGYRTGLSRKNQANWDYAQKMSAKVMMKLSGIMLIVHSILSGILFCFGVNLLIIFPCQIAIIVLSAIGLLFYCESKLRTFDQTNISPADTQ